MVQGQGVEMEAGRRLQAQTLQPGGGGVSGGLQVGQGLQTPVAAAAAAAAAHHHGGPETGQVRQFLRSTAEGRSQLPPLSWPRQGHQPLPPPGLLQAGRRRLGVGRVGIEQQGRPGGIGHAGSRRSATGRWRFRAR